MQINELSFCPYLQVLFESSLYSLHQSNFRILEHLAVFLDKGRLHLKEPQNTWNFPYVAVYVHFTKCLPHKIKLMKLISFYP